MATHSSIQYTCLQNPHGQTILAGYSPWGHTESDTTEVTSHARTHDISPLHYASLKDDIFLHNPQTSNMIAMNVNFLVSSNIYPHSTFPICLSISILEFLRSNQDPVKTTFGCYIRKARNFCLRSWLS